MKKFLFLFLLISYTGTFAQNDANLVISNMKAQETAWNKGDIAGFMNYYWKSDSLMFISKRGVTYGWQQTMDNYIKNYPTKEAMGQLSFTLIKTIKLSPTHIYVIGKWELLKATPAGGHFTLLWRKINNEWVIVSDHTS